MEGESVAPLGTDAVARVDAAVAEAERGTSAEIVVGLARRSGRYLHVGYEAGLIGALVALAIYSTGFWLMHRTWPVAAVDVFLLVAAAGFALGALVARSESAARALAGEAAMLDSCERRAREMFATHGVQRTSARNGVLVYVSLFERIILIAGDDAATAALGADAYRGLVEAAIRELRAGRVEAALTGAVAELGRALAAAFPRAADDVNELPDRLYLV